MACQSDTFKLLGRVQQWGETERLLTLPGPGALVYAQRVGVIWRRQVDPNRQRCGKLAAIARSTGDRAPLIEVPNAK